MHRNRRNKSPRQHKRCHTRTNVGYGREWHQHCYIRTNVGSHKKKKSRCYTRTNNEFKSYCTRTYCGQGGNDQAQKVKSINILPVKPFMATCRKVHDSGKITNKYFKVTEKCIEKWKSLQLGCGLHENMQHIQSRGAVGPCNCHPFYIIFPYF